MLASNPTISDAELRETLHNAVDTLYREKEALITPDIMRRLEKSVMLQSLDQHWREHLGAMDHLRQGIHLRGYAQKNPKQEYKREAFNLFTALTDNIKRDVLSTLLMFHPQPHDARILESARQQSLANVKIQYRHEEADAIAELSHQEQPANTDNSLPFTRDHVKVGRNDPCPCGSGKKYKQCHGMIE